MLGARPGAGMIALMLLIALLKFVSVSLLLLDVSQLFL